MLLQNGKKVHVQDRVHWSVLAGVREVLTPERTFQGKMFKIEQRAQIIDKRKAVY